MKQQESHKYLPLFAARDTEVVAMNIDELSRAWREDDETNLID